MEAWTAHRGLVDTIGPYSEATKSALSQALSYLGISCTTTEPNSTDNFTFALTLSNKEATGSSGHIEFDSKTRSWHHTQGAGTANDGASTTFQAQEVQLVSSADAEVEHSASPPLSKGVRDDWTVWLPKTSHVDFLKSREWHKTSLGPMLEWPDTLKLMAMKMLYDPRPANLYWGSTRTAIYNEAFSVVAASRHPMMMGSTAEAAMPATYPFLSGIFDEIERSNVAFSMPEFEMFVEKLEGFVEEAWYDGIFSPIRDTDGTFLGLYNSGFDITDRKLTQRNSQIIHQIAAGPASPKTSPWQHLIDVCSGFERDIPFLVLYSADGQEDKSSSGLTAHYEGSLGIKRGHPSLPEHLDLYHGNEGFRQVLRVANVKETSVPLDMPDGKLPDFLQEGVDWRGHGDPCTRIVASPLYVTGVVTGFVVIGLNPRRRYDEAHKQFVEDIGRAANGLLASSVSVDQARRREEKLTQELTQRQKFLQRVAEIATVGIYAHSTDGLLTWANPMYFDMCGITQKPEERYNYQGLDSILDEDREKSRQGFVRCLETKSAYNLELRLKKTWRPPGSEHDEPCWIMTSVTPNVEDDQVIEVLGCVSDISHLKWAENLQTKTAKAAKRAKQQQERFIDITSHEMRNPLSAILQCADDITMIFKDYQGSWGKEADGQLKEAFQTIVEDARTITFCATHQKRIVDDILAVSKLESSMLAITPVTVDPRTVVMQVMQVFAAEMAAEDIRSAFEVQAGYDDLRITSTLIDPSRLTQILINLMTNAIKFTKTASRRKVCVRINGLTKRPPLHDPASQIQWFPSSMQLARLAKSPVSETSDEAIYIMFEVEDSGTGISRDEMTNLFNRFAQATPKTHVTYGGSGLGLFISRELAELQGGMVGVSSQPGAGSTFAFYIETRRATPAEDFGLQLQQNASHEHLNTIARGKDQDGHSTPRAINKQTPTNFSAAPRPRPLGLPSILFVEDNLINQKVLSKQLERLGCRVYVANHGVEALHLIEKSVHWKGNETDSLKIDVVVMDWEMPIMDGLTCTKRIREMEEVGSITKHLPILGATANARSEQVETAVSAGMDDLITKPFTVTALMKRIENLIR